MLRQRGTARSQHYPAQELADSASHAESTPGEEVIADQPE
jgi:hypothetical protein